MPEELLDRLVAYAGEGGIAHASLRQLAAGIGTSHRMLIHHFGSKQGVLIALAHHVENRQREALRALLDEGHVDIWQFWERLVDPQVAPFERLFFELYGQALQGESWAAPLLDGVVDDWLEPVTAALRTRNADADRIDARLAIAVTRGLLLDLLATGDHTAVADAMRRYVRCLEQRAPRQPNSA